MVITNISREIAQVHEVYKIKIKFQSPQVISILYIEA